MPCLFPLLPGLAVSDDGGCPCARHCSNRSSCINSLPRQPHREASARTKPTAHLQMQASLGPESITLHSQQQVWTYLRLGPLLSGSTPPHGNSSWRPRTAKSRDPAAIFLRRLSDFFTSSAPWLPACCPLFWASSLPCSRAPVTCQDLCWRFRDA